MLATRLARAGILVALLPGRPAVAAERPVVLELFTSQGCSSCPPAEKLLLDLDGTRPDVLALAYHVDYWDRLGWKDPFSSHAFTERQRAYQAAAGSEQVYTPQAIVDGRIDVLGSDAAAVSAALKQAEASRAPAVQISLARTGRDVHVRVGPGAGRGTVVLVGYDDRHETIVRRGENAGRTILQANVVRSVTDLGKWLGRDVAFDVPAPAGDRMVVLLPSADGGMLGVAR